MFAEFTKVCLFSCAIHVIKIWNKCVKISHHWHYGSFFSLCDKASTVYWYLKSWSFTSQFGQKNKANQFQIHLNTYGFYSINRQKKPATVPGHEWPSIISRLGTRLVANSMYEIYFIINITDTQCNFPARRLLLTILGEIFVAWHFLC